MEEGPLPLGFGMALMQNAAAMQGYEQMTKEEKEKLMRQLHGVQSKSEMRRLVAQLSDRRPGNEVG